MDNELQSKPQKIRPATRADFPYLVHAGSHFWDAAPYARQGVPYNPEAVNSLLETMYEDHYLIVATHGTTITGFLGLWIAPFMFNPDLTVATELFFFVNPKYRGKGTGRALHLNAEQDLEGEVDILSFGDLSTSTNMEAYYSTGGFIQTERIYSKVL